VVPPATVADVAKRATENAVLIKRALAAERVAGGKLEVGGMRDPVTALTYYNRTVQQVNGQSIDMVEAKTKDAMVHLKCRAFLRWHRVGSDGLEDHE